MRGDSYKNQLPQKGPRGSNKLFHPLLSRPRRIDMVHCTRNLTTATNASATTSRAVRETLHAHNVAKVWRHREENEQGLWGSTGKKKGNQNQLFANHNHNNEPAELQEKPLMLTMWAMFGGTETTLRWDWRAKHTWEREKSYVRDNFSPTIITTKGPQKLHTMSDQEAPTQ